VTSNEANRADLGKDPARVSGMFDQVAAGYDRTNTAMTVGNDALWRAATTRAVAPKPGEKILDLGAGTASSSASLARSGAQVVAADFSPGMLAEGQRRHGSIRNLSFVQADATDLPFDDGEFDAVTMSYALRNVNDPKKLAAWIREAGWTEVEYRNLSFGIVALHRAFKPA